MLRGSGRAGGSPALPATCTAGRSLRCAPPPSSTARTVSWRHFKPPRSRVALRAGMATRLGEGREAVAGVLVLPAQRPGVVLQSPRKAKGAPGGARVVLSTQPHSLLASSPRQIGSHKQGRQFLGMVPLSCVMLGGQQVTALPQQARRSSSAGEISALKRFPLQNKPELVYQDFHQSRASCVVVGAGGAG